MKHKTESLESLFSLKGKVAIVTGAAGYLGRGCTEALLLAGAKVALFGRGDKIKEYADQLNDRYNQDQVQFYSVDLYQDQEFRLLLQQAGKKNGRIDVLVNNAFEFSKETGFNHPSGKMETISKSQWMKSLESGVYWHSLATQTLLPMMVRQGSGSIINISSMYGIVSPDPNLYKGTEVFNPPSYGAAKAALLALTRYTASFYGKAGIRCNAIAPGAFPNMDPSAFNSPDNNEFLKRLEDRTVLKRCGKPDDLRGVIIFLASDASNYITGQTFSVDGGWTIK